MNIRIRENEVDFDDVLLIPRPSSINSRKFVDLSSKLLSTNNIKLKIPIIASPMRGITSLDLIIEIANLGGIGILHRFFEYDSLWRIKVKNLSINCPYGVAIGLNDDRYKFALDMGARIICVDVANGYIDALHKFCGKVADYIQQRNYSCVLMSGNVVTLDGASCLSRAGVDLVRVGIGSGNLCSTRNITGVGYPQLSAVRNCRVAGGNWKVVADGGVRNSGDIVKALAAGADFVMIGSMFAKAYESSNNSGLIYGMASRKLQEEYYHATKSVEGVEERIEKSCSLRDIIDELVWGIKSACTYLNASNLKQLRENAEFVRVGNNTIKDL